MLNKTTKDNPMDQDVFAGQWRQMRGALKARMTVVALIATLVTGGALMSVGCEREGPVEKAGKKVDQAVEEVKDKLNPEGPVEKAGKKVDQAVEEAKDK
jgi:uncharacterized protein YjbJ (UPF0337 family)